MSEVNPDSDNPNKYNIKRVAILLGTTTLASYASYEHGHANGVAQASGLEFERGYDAGLEVAKLAAPSSDVYKKPFTKEPSQLVANINSQFDVDCRITGKDPDETGPLPPEISYKIKFETHDGHTIRGFVAPHPKFPIITVRTINECANP